MERNETINTRLNEKKTGKTGRLIVLEQLKVCPPYYFLFKKKLLNCTIRCTKIVIPVINVVLEIDKTTSHQ